MIKYRAERRQIVAVEVLRETASQVVIQVIFGGKTEERREAKTSEWRSYHDTWEEARDHLMKAAEIRVMAARRSLELANADLGNIKGMKKPDGVS